MLVILIKFGFCWCFFSEKRIECYVDGGICMKKIANVICEHKNLILIITAVLFVLSFVGMKLTNINYDILVYLPDDIETVQGQNILTDDFEMGAYSVVIAEGMNSKQLLKLEEEIGNVEYIRNS